MREQKRRLMTITTTLATDAIGNSFTNAATTFEFDHVSIDSRSLQNGASTLFFLFKRTQSRCASIHRSINSKGVEYFVVEYIPSDVKDKAHFVWLTIPLMHYKN